MICLVISEITLFNITKKDYDVFCKNFNLHLPALKYSIKMKSYEESYKELPQTMNIPDGATYSKRPIVLFGCSFTYGSGLKENQKFSYKLSEYTKRPVYNRGIPGSGIQHMYYQLSKENFYAVVKRKPEYIIYTYIPDYHLHRMYEYTFHLFSDDLYLRYVPNKKDSKGNLIRVSDYIPPYINGLYTVKALFKVRLNHILKKDMSYHDRFTHFLFYESMQKAKTQYEDTKFVVMCYEIDNKPHNSCANKKELFKMLEKDGFIVLNTKDIIGQDLDKREDRLSESDDHPTERVWNLIVPALAKKLNL